MTSQGGILRRWIRSHVPHCLGVLIAVAFVFRLVLAIDSPRPWGYVWDRYDPGIRLLYENGTLPESPDCWQCYHPPVFYYAGASFYWLGSQFPGDGSARSRAVRPLYFVGLLSLICSAVVLLYCYRFLRFYKFQGDYLILGFATAGIFPCLFISSWGIEADIVLTALMCGFAYEIAKYSISGEEAATREVVLAGILAGLAMATKYNGILAIVTALPLFALKHIPGRQLKRLARDASMFLAIALALGSWKYIDNYVKYDNPLFANGSAAAGFSLSKKYHWQLYDFSSFRLGELIHLMSDEGPDGRLQQLPTYRSVWTTLHALAWSDMSFFSREGRHGLAPNIYPRKSIPIWMPASVLGMALLPNALALIGSVVTFRRRSVRPLLLLTVLTFVVYIQWVVSQRAWALKSKYILFLLPAYLVYMLFGLRWVEERVPAVMGKALWAAMTLLLLATYLYMFQFSIG